MNNHFTWLSYCKGRCDGPDKNMSSVVPRLEGKSHGDISYPHLRHALLSSRKTGASLIYHIRQRTCWPIVYQKPLFHRSNPQDFTSRCESYKEPQVLQAQYAEMGPRLPN